MRRNYDDMSVQEKYSTMEELVRGKWWANTADPQEILSVAIHGMLGENVDQYRFLTAVNGKFSVNAEGDISFVPVSAYRTLLTWNDTDENRVISINTPAGEIRLGKDALLENVNLLA